MWVSELSVARCGDLSTEQWLSDPPLQLNDLRDI